MTTEVNLTMPFVTDRRRRGRLVAALSALSLLAAAPAAQAATKTAANPLGCTPEAALVQPFTAWSDTADYTLSPGADFEATPRDWVLINGARITDGNEPFHVGNASDNGSLALPTGSTAVSAPICIDDTYPWFRLFARNTGDLKSTLKVEVLYLDTKGKLTFRASGTYQAPSTDWAPTGTMKIDLAFDPTSAGGAAPVAFRFTPQGKGGDWQIDDVYVDPYRRF